MGSMWALWNNICRCPQQVSPWETLKARVRISLQSVRAPRWGLLPPVGWPPIERVGDSGGQSESQLSGSENTLLRAAAFSWVTSSWESWRHWRPEWDLACRQWERPAEGCCPQRPPVEQLQPSCGRSAR